LIHYDKVSEALVSAVEYNAAKAVILGFPVEGTFQGFQEILETVARHVACPVLVLRMYDPHPHTERILVSVWLTARICRFWGLSSGPFPYR
jgi:hypothetical protein